MPDWIALTDVARRAGIGRNVIQAAVDRGEIDSASGMRTLLDPDSVDRWIQSTQTGIRRTETVLS